MGDDESPMNIANSKKITCKICWKPVKVIKNIIKMTCMCDDENRLIHLDKIENWIDNNVVQIENLDNK